MFQEPRSNSTLTGPVPRATDSPTGGGTAEPNENGAAGVAKRSGHGGGSGSSGAGGGAGQGGMGAVTKRRRLPRPGWCSTHCIARGNGSRPASRSSRCCRRKTSRYALCPETLIGAIQPGAHVRVSVDGIRESLSGTVSYISPKAEYTPPCHLQPGAATTGLHGGSDICSDIAAGLHPGQPVDVEFGSAR